MASDPAVVDLAHRLRSRIWCRECLGAVPAVDTCEACGGTGCTRESLEAIRAALDAARAEEREAGAKACERVATELAEDDWKHAARACAAAIRGRG